MPSEVTVHTTVAELISQLTHHDAATITPTTRLSDVDIDSLLSVELAEELGRRYGVYLSDEAINHYRTVQDVIRSVVHHNGEKAPAWASVAPPAVELGTDDLPVDRTALKAGAVRMGLIMAAIGLGAGAVVGLGAKTLVTASGLSEASLPPLATSDSPTPEPSVTETTPPPPPPEDAPPEPTLTTPKAQVAPGERFTLAGTFPGAGPDAQLQVQFKEGDGPWEDFPVTAATRGDESFETQVYTSRTGQRLFRMLLIGTEQTTPEVSVTIG